MEQNKQPEGKTIDYRSLVVAGVITVLLMALFSMGAIPTVLIFLGVYYLNKRLSQKKNKT